VAHGRRVEEKLASVERGLLWASEHQGKRKEGILTNALSKGAESWLRTLSSS
jgi:hypothetical protein